MSTNTQALELLGTSKKFGEMLEAYREDLVAVVPKHIDAERFLKVALLAAIRQPKLLQCTRSSIIEALMTATSLGLEVNGVLGSGYLIPYDVWKQGRVVSTVAQFQPGYRGLIDLARRSGVITSVYARLVYPVDKLEVVQGTEESIVHVPDIKNPGELKDYYCGYAVAKLADGTSQFDIMTVAKIEEIRARSKSGGKVTFNQICTHSAKDVGPWGTDYEEMAKKTVVKRLCKYLPLNPDVAAAIALDDRIETGDITGVTPELDTEASLTQHMADKTRGATDELRSRAEKARPVRDTIDVSPEPSRETSRARRTTGASKSAKSSSEYPNFVGEPQAKTPKEYPKRDEIRMASALATGAKVTLKDVCRKRYGINADELSPDAMKDLKAYLKFLATKGV